eukprot:TRINITY_DN4796_c0_g1_i2.p3 TRINITY_DN4796_c0_g1~~TRINITY_DN4796_c0_g1_i2.p3  ORF type:complete len:126 (+),score=20.30 TRINITY_DN4796_c0_g1_i2:217-594(+)
MSELSPMLTLPRELQVRVLRCFSLEQVAACALTSRSWARLSHSPDLFHNRVLYVPWRLLHLVANQRSEHPATRSWAMAAEVLLPPHPERSRIHRHLQAEWGLRPKLGLSGGAWLPLFYMGGYPMG